MSVVKNLEAMINLENNLRSQYAAEIQSLQNQIATLTGNQESLQGTQESLQKTITEQQKNIATLTAANAALTASNAELSAVNIDVKRLEQTNRELTNRAENLQAEIDVQKARMKIVQKDLGEARQHIKTLELYDAEKLKKNLVTTKQTLAEQRTANELLNKTAHKTKAENAELQNKVKELEKELELLKETTATDAETTEVEAAEDISSKAA